MSKQIFLFAWTCVFWWGISSTLTIKSNIQQSTMNWNETSFQKPRQVMFQNWDMHAFQTHLGGRREGMQPLLNSNPLTLQDELLLGLLAWKPWDSVLCWNYYSITLLKPRFGEMQLKFLGLLFLQQKMWKTSEAQNGPRRYSSN